MTKPVRTEYLSEFFRPGVFRASALFWVIEANEVATTVEFLSYWKFKHGVLECTALWTLRDSDGTVVAHRQEVITQVRGHTVAVKEMLSGSGTRPIRRQPRIRAVRRS